MGKRIRLVCDWCGTTANEFTESDPAVRRRGRGWRVDEVDARTPSPSSSTLKGWLTILTEPAELSPILTDDADDSDVLPVYADICPACATRLTRLIAEIISEKPLPTLVTPIRKR